MKEVEYCADWPDWKTSEKTDENYGFKNFFSTPVLEFSVYFCVLIITK